MATPASFTIAAVSLTSVVWWLVVGMLAGLFASAVTSGGNYGIVGDLIVGIIGALIGGFLVNMIGFDDSGILWSIAVAFIGACVLIVIFRAVSSGERRTL